MFRKDEEVKTEYKNCHSREGGKKNPEKRKNIGKNQLTGGGGLRRLKATWSVKERKLTKNNRKKQSAMKEGGKM